MNEIQEYLKWMLSKVEVSELQIIPCEARYDDVPELPRIIAYKVNIIGTLPVFEEGNKSE